MKKLLNHTGKYALAFAIALNSIASGDFDKDEEIDRGYYSNIDSNLEKKVDYSSFGLPNQVYINRLEEFKDEFEKYSCDKPELLTEKEFMALLVSVAQKESSLGYPNGRKTRYDKVLMGYGNSKDEKYLGLENQLSLASSTLKRALNEEHQSYKASFSKEGDEKLKAVLSIYNQGSINSAGLSYAKEVYSNYLKWANYLNNHLI